MSLAPGDTRWSRQATDGAGAGTGEVDLTAVGQLHFLLDEGYCQVPVVTSRRATGMWASITTIRRWPAVARGASPRRMRRARCRTSASTSPATKPSSIRVIALPKPFVHLNVQKPQQYADTILLQVRKGGVFQAFVNGETLREFTAATAGWQRIGGQLRDSTWTTGLYHVEIVVRRLHQRVADAAGLGDETPGGEREVLDHRPGLDARGRATRLSAVRQLAAHHRRRRLRRLLPQVRLGVRRACGRILDCHEKRQGLEAPLRRFDERLPGQRWSDYRRLRPVQDGTQFHYTTGTYRLTTIRDPNSQDLVLAYGNYGLLRFATTSRRIGTRTSRLYPTARSRRFRTPTG